MSLSCYCYYDYEYDLGDWTYSFSSDEDFIRLDTSRAKRCCSCGKLIRVGDVCIKYQRYRYPYSEIEARIKLGTDIETVFNDEPRIRIADHYHCEWCGEIYLNLIDLGYECLSPSEDMRTILKEYHELSGFEDKLGKPQGGGMVCLEDGTA